MGDIYNTQGKAYGLKAIIHHIWGQTDVKWKDADWTWSEKELVGEILVSGGGDENAIPGFNAWLQKNKDKKRKAIRILFKIKGKEFDETKDYSDVQLKVKDVKLMAKAVLGIELNVKVTK